MRKIIFTIALMLLSATVCLQAAGSRAAEDNTVEYNPESPKDPMPNGDEYDPESPTDPMPPGWDYNPESPKDPMPPGSDYDPESPEDPMPIDPAEDPALQAFRETYRLLRDTLDMKSMEMYNLYMTYMDTAVVYTPGIQTAFNAIFDEINDCYQVVQQAYLDRTLLAVKNTILSRLTALDARANAIPAKIAANEQAYVLAMRLYEQVGDAYRRANDTLQSSAYSDVALKVMTFQQTLAELWEQYDALAAILSEKRADFTLADAFAQYSGQLTIMITMPTVVMNSFLAAVEEIRSAVPEQVTMENVVENIVEDVDAGVVTIEDTNSGVKVEIATDVATETPTVTVNEEEGTITVSAGQVIGITSEVSITTLTITIPQGSSSNIVPNTGSIVTHSPVARRMIRALSSVAPETENVIWVADPDAGDVYSVDFTVQETVDNQGFTFAEMAIVSEPVQRDIRISSETKWKTFIAPFDVVVSGRSFDAYAVTGIDMVDGEAVLAMSRITDTIRANTPVLLYAENGYIGVVTGVARGKENLYTSGIMTGVSNDQIASGYMLAVVDGELAFYPVTNGLVSANTAFVSATESYSRIFITAEAIYAKAQALYEQQREQIAQMAESLYASDEQMEAAIMTATSQIRAREFDTTLSLDANIEVLRQVLANLQLELARMNAYRSLDEALGVNPSVAVLLIYNQAQNDIYNAASEAEITQILSDALRDILNTQYQEEDTPTSLIEHSALHVQRILMDGRVCILLNDRIYDLLGTPIL